MILYLFYYYMKPIKYVSDGPNGGHIHQLKLQFKKIS